jgi:cytochrome c peroxidase
MLRFVVAIGLMSVGLAWVLADQPVPRGLPPITTPAAKPALITLGKHLFSETKLSADGSLSCASCHHPEKSFASSDTVAVGINNQKGRRNAPSLLNRVFGSSFSWDGRAKTLEEQSLLPITHPQEMGNTLERVLKVLKEDREYPTRFRLVFGSEEITADRIASALAAFQRTLLLGNSPVDTFMAGDIAKLSVSARQGLWLFESKASCWKCHSGKNYSDERFHNTGVSWRKTPVDLGRYEITKQEADRGRFKTPTLRGVARTGPYMHDGSIKTLEEVVNYYDEGGNANEHLDRAVKPLHLSEQDRADLLAFLKALSEVVE